MDELSTVVGTEEVVTKNEVQVDPYEQEREAQKRQTKVQIRGLVGKL